MAKYGISGVWKDENDTITHYAFHTADDKPTGSRATKTSKSEAIKLLEKAENTAYTWLWDYVSVGWLEGEKVEVVGNGAKKYLRSDPDNKLTDNLSHLIDFDWIFA